MVKWDVIIWYPKGLFGTSALFEIELHLSEIQLFQLEYLTNRMFSKMRGVHDSINCGQNIEKAVGSAGRKGSSMMKG